MAIHLITGKGEPPEVWLDTDEGVSECDGICIGTGQTVVAAALDAERTLGAALEELDRVISTALVVEWKDRAKPKGGA